MLETIMQFVDDEMPTVDYSVRLIGLTVPFHVILSRLTSVTQ